MINIKKKASYNDIIYHVLSRYNTNLLMDMKFDEEDTIITNYFLENNSWESSFFTDMTEFHQERLYIKKDSVTFNFDTEMLNKEFKVIFHHKIFSGEWDMKQVFGFRSKTLNSFVAFMHVKYPNTVSLLTFSTREVSKLSLKWIDWISDNPYIEKSFAENMIKTFNIILNPKLAMEEWEKDRWDIRTLSKKYGIQYSGTDSTYYIIFEKIKNKKIREILKKYIKTRLLMKNKFSLKTAVAYPRHIGLFANYLHNKYPKIKDFKDINREDILGYIEYLSCLVTDISVTKHPEQYMRAYISYLQNFLGDLTLYNSEVAPLISIKRLILEIDKPNVSRKSVSAQIKYVPDVVLEQLFEHINDLNKDITGVIYVMLKTGLRVSNVLTLNYDSLIKLDNQFWLETDISKVYIEKHRVPIDDELARVIAVLIDKSKYFTNLQSNPNKYIFASSADSRKGLPIGKDAIRAAMNRLAKKYNIIDEDGKLYHFKNHAFRHTYAIKLLNNGVDILTVQELLAHASPEMTVRYARLLDDTKRKTFDAAVRQGVFSFDESNTLKEENKGEIPEDILEMLYTNHKLNAIDTPYGTCMQKTNGKCTFAKQPPCLTCVGGKPCKDLCIGAFDGDKIKYEILVDSTTKIIDSAKLYNRPEMARENEELLSIYNDIYSKISTGNIVYGRLDRLKRGLDE